MSGPQNQEQSNFPGFQVIQPIRVVPQPSPNLQLYEPFNFQNCPQVFTFPQQGNLHWGPLSYSQDLATPTNLPAAINKLGAICSATPEFIHPRNSNAPQWLMSPPVEEIYPHPPTPMTLNPPDATLTPPDQETGLMSPPPPPSEKEVGSFPIGVFWDIENCAVPAGKSAAQIVIKIRNSFFQGHKEVEFMAVCDINKETRRVVQDLNDAQVSVVHVSSRSKNAADEKLRQSLRRFAQTYTAPATVLLITGDCDFMAEISDLRHRHNFFVVLVHPCRTRQVMRDSANTAVKFEEFVGDLPLSYPLKELSSESQLIVSNLPLGVAPNSVLEQLTRMSRSFHGHVTKVTLPTAAIRFPSDDLSRRAMRRLQGSEVMGSIVTVQRRSSDLSALSKHFTPRQSRQRHPGDDIHRTHTENVRPTDNKAVDKNVHVTISNIDAQLGVKNIQQKICQIFSKLSPILKLQIRPHNRFTVVCDVIVPSIERASVVLQQLHRTRIGNKRILLTIAQNTSCSGDAAPSSDQSVCPTHFPTNQRWSKRGGLLKIEIGLREFSAKLHALLHTHDGAVYIDGFENCYMAEFGSFPYPISSENGVYFHHQVSYVPGVQIIEDKVIMWSQPPSSDNYSDTASEASSSSRSKSSNLVSSSREAVNFLKCFPYCAVPYTDFKKLYSSKLGRSFGETLSSIPHVVQIIGTNEDKLVTLTHRAQVKRFIVEITKILKTSPDRAILVAQLPDMYRKCFDRAWKLRDYGVSVLTDILDDIPEGNILVSGDGDNIVLSLPTRVRTQEEVDHTEAFSLEVVEILRSRPQHRLSFTDFVPSYHRHFGRQCKLSKYGFNKLLDLFEALTSVVKVVEVGGEKYLQLCESEQIKVLSSQVVALLRHHMATMEDDKQPQGVPLSRLQALFSRKFGFPLVPKYFNCSDIQQLVAKLSHAVKMEVGDQGEIFLQQSERRPVRLLSIQLLVLLLDSPQRRLDLDSLHLLYRDRYKEVITPHNYGFLTLCDVIKRALSGIAKFSESSDGECLTLKAIYHQARKIRNILLLHEGAMTLGEFNQAYKATHGESLNPEKYGFRSNEGLLRALTLVLVVKGFGIKKTLVLRNHMKYGPLSSSTKEGKAPDGEAPEGKPPPLQEIINNNSPPKSKPNKSSGDSRGAFPQFEDKLQTPPIFPNFGTDYADSYARYQSTIEPYLDKTPSLKDQQDTKPSIDQPDHETPYLYHPFQPFACDIRRCRSQPESFYQQNTIHNHPSGKHQLGHHPSLEILPKPNVEMVQSHHFGGGLFTKHHQQINGGFQQNGSFNQTTACQQDGFHLNKHHPQIGTNHSQNGPNQQNGSNYLQNGVNHPHNGPNHPHNGPNHPHNPHHLHQRRKISVSVITLPNGTTSISSNSSPDSFLSTDEEVKSSPEGQQGSPLQLASAFSTVTLVPP